MTHRFEIGSIVSLNTGESRAGPKPGRYVVEAQMPPVGTSLQYRIKSEAEGFRRVVVEHDLIPFGEMSEPAPTPPPARSDGGGEED